MWSDDGDARADDTADASVVATTLGAVCAPDGFVKVSECPLHDVTTWNNTKKVAPLGLQGDNGTKE